MRQIVSSLEETLDQMEDVLRLIEQAERQQTADGRELDQLRRSLRRIQPPRPSPPSRSPRRDEPPRSHHEPVQPHEEPPDQPEPDAPPEDRGPDE